MPSLGADMDAGTLVKWLVKPGDRVTRGDIVAVVQTEKADVDVEVFATGTIESLAVPEGKKVPVGTLLATIRGEGEEGPLSAAPPAAAAAVPPTAPPPPTVPLPPPPGRAREGPRVSPIARRIAGELGVDLARVAGTGPSGAITRDDVEKAAAAVSAPPPLDRRAAMRQAIAAAMTRANREIPHYYLSASIDLAAAAAYLTSVNEKRAVEERILPAVLLLKSTALALREVPELNGFWRDGGFVAGNGIHVGVAISLRGGGLVAPAIHDADRRSLEELMRDLRDLVGRARAGTLRSSEVSDPTITVTNLGDLGVDSVLGVIFPPQVALVGFGRIEPKPVVRDGQVVARPAVTASLAADHRATDGHRGAVFLTAVDRLLQKPEDL